MVELGSVNVNGALIAHFGGFGVFHCSSLGVFAVLVSSNGYGGSQPFP